MSGPSKPKAPKPPKPPTMTRNQAQRELDARIRDFPTSGPDAVLLRLFNVAESSQSQLDDRPDSDFLAPVEQRDFQGLDSQIRSNDAANVQGRRPKRPDEQSILDLLGEGGQSPTIL